MTELVLGELSILYLIGMADPHTIEAKQKIKWCNTFGLLFSCTPQDWILRRRHLVGLDLPDQEYGHVIAGTDQKQSQEQGTEPWLHLIYVMVWKNGQETEAASKRWRDAAQQ